MLISVFALLGFGYWSNLVVYTGADQQQGEFCHLEYFQPRCQKNEVILITSALLGRMRIGRCLTADELTELSGPRYFGCSADVLPFLEDKCSGKHECEVRVADIPIGKNMPCFASLKMYLEVSYVCLNTVDESRSCTVAATTNPVHIIVSQSPTKICGTKSQPWIVESPIGKKIKTSLIELNAPSSDQNEEQHTTRCYQNEQGMIIDKIGQRNASICRDYEKRETLIHSSGGNVVNIIFNELQSKEDNSKGTYLIRIEAILSTEKTNHAIGCSDIVPPEDTWLKRSDDAISIGCYSSRQTWRLNCQDGKWIGVLGNCSTETLLEVEPETMEQKTTISEDEQVLAIVAIVGCTLAICMAIVCTGAVCLRRFYVQSKRDRTYKTLSCNYDLNGDNTTDLRIHSQTLANTSGNDSRCSNEPQIPTYSVYVGDGTFRGPSSTKQDA